MQKLLTFAVPCYNSAAYMEKCVETLLQGGTDIEIILVDDGSYKDSTPEICDRYAEQYPDIIKVIHQKNGGHGEGVNQGLRNATGLYFKVVDSDDWLDVPSLRKVIEKLREFSTSSQPVDLFITNYVYEHVQYNSPKVMAYTNVFPVETLFKWDDIGNFRPSQYLLMHSVIYRTEILRDCGLILPKKTFYVDNIFVYQPLPYVESIYYMNVDLYRYFIGRSDQSVNEKIMIGRIDQQLRVTKLMIGIHDLHQIKRNNKNLGKYMINHLSMLMTISSIFLIITNTPEAFEKKAELWNYLQITDPAMYRRLRYFHISTMVNLPGKLGGKLSVFIYKIVRRIFKFN